jgi:hypothetical protein
MPESLYRAHIPSLEVLDNLIIYFRDNYGYMVYFFINILIDILNYLYKYINLNINIRAEFLEEV